MQIYGIWGYNFEEAFDRFNLIVKFAQEHKEIVDTMRLGAKIFSEKLSSDFKFAPLGLSFYLELPENEEIPLSLSLVESILKFFIESNCI